MNNIIRVIDGFKSNTVYIIKILILYKLKGNIGTELDKFGLVGKVIYYKVKMIMIAMIVMEVYFIACF